MSVLQKSMTTAILGMVAGVAIGTAVGLMLAPQSGARTRRKVRRYSKRAQARVLRFGRNVRTSVDRAIIAGKAMAA